MSPVNVAKEVWTGFWQGIGVWLAGFVFWLVWRITHNKIAHKFEDGHWFHIIHEFFQ